MCKLDRLHMTLPQSAITYHYATPSNWHKMPESVWIMEPIINAHGWWHLRAIPIPMRQYGRHDECIIPTFIFSNLGMRPQTSYIWNLEISLDQVDDEKHFLMVCKFHSTESQSLIEVIISILKLDRVRHHRVISVNHGLEGKTVLQALAKFVYGGYQKRDDS